MKPKNIILIAVISFFSLSSYAQSDIADIILHSENHTTFTAAIKAANLVSTLKEKGPYTIFAPTNEAFDKLEQGKLQFLLQSENKATLSTTLTYHIIPAYLTATNIVNQITIGDGTFKMTTVAGNILTASIKGGDVLLTDSLGNTAKIIATDLKGSNGIIHVIDGVLMPRN
ncbi:fasciclin domain-containing protein [Dokdonia sp. 4H-3-7-5]|uniref:fasciclin domain-containing protein n=1 Tax=Dokdonia sp. (strain 4H-3-7-5) TaxID=983548 RepID=UPI00020A74FF|nr:fasciclin domain-containing protein [Dokdonia sp. 4H-3-7-5]AEE19771.1 beta-Ig-H3/fasciclin [Dokdonia sp. 4H-3-7-5]